MKKIIFNFLCFALFILGIYFSYQSFSMIYFNKFPINIPNLMNMNFTEAAKLANTLGLNVEVVAKEYSSYKKDLIYKQVPSEGTISKAGRTIRVSVSKGIFGTSIINFTQLPFNIASEKAEKMGLKVKNLAYVSHDYPFNTVISSDPPTGVFIKNSKEISFLISLGNENILIEMPNLFGLNYKEALEILETKKLIGAEPRYIENKNMPNGTVVHQNINAFKLIPIGTRVELIITN